MFNISYLNYLNTTYALEFSKVNLTDLNYTDHN